MKEQRVKLFLAVWMVLLYQSAGAQMFLDTVWFDIHWKQSVKEKAQYYRLVYADTSGTVQFLVKDYYKSGSLQMEGTYKSINPDLRNGQFTYYFSNGQKSSRMLYKDNMIDGTVQEWYSNGKPKSLASYENETLNGTRKTWREDGTISLEVNYRNGDLDGPFISYYVNGNKVRQDLYARGNLKRKRCFTQNGKDTTWFPYLEMPEFPGGPQKFKEFVEKNLVYPADARKRKWQGRVDLEVSISNEGKILKAIVVRSDREIFNDEAIRLALESPAWKPGKKDGQCVEITLTIPIWFRLRTDLYEQE